MKPLDQSIWATRGPLGESPPLFSIQHLPSSYLICRAASEQVSGMKVRKRMEPSVDYETLYRDHEIRIEMLTFC